MSKNQKSEQTPTEEAQAAKEAAELAAKELAAKEAAEQAAAEQAAKEAEEQAAKEKAKLEAEAAEQAAKDAEQAEKSAKEQAAKEAEEQALLDAAKAAETKYTVIMRFFSKDKIQYEIGDDVSHLDAERLDSLVNRGLVSKS
jgi:hypothetical protein